MLSKKERLSRNSFKTLLLDKTLSIVYNKLGTLKWIPGTPHFSVIVSSRHEKSAVNRNTIRRRLYTIFRQKKPSISAVLYLSKNSYSLTYEELKKNLHDLFKKCS